VTRKRDKVNCGRGEDIGNRNNMKREGECDDDKDKRNDIHYWKVL
jgi:hypothetical protein